MATDSNFFTINLAERKWTLLVDNIGLLREVVARVRQHHPFHIETMAALANHLHALWTLPNGDGDYPMRWMLIKAGFLRRESGAAGAALQRENGAYGNVVIGNT